MIQEWCVEALRSKWRHLNKVESDVTGDKASIRARVFLCQCIITLKWKHSRGHGENKRGAHRSTVQTVLAQCHPVTLAFESSRVGSCPSGVYPVWLVASEAISVQHRATATEHTTDLPTHLHLNAKKQCLWAALVSGHCRGLKTWVR